MNVIFFGLKRAFQSTLRLTRPLVSAFGLTAARFDLLYAVSKKTHFLQSDLRRTLGVTAPTVSRMLRSLERLGFVRRIRSPLDGRQRWIYLTREGEIRLRRVAKWAISSGAVQLAVDCALTALGDCVPRPLYSLDEMSKADWMLKRVRVAFGDQGSLYYPWTPDD